MEYNTTRNKLIMREYGRHIQNMVEKIRTIEDPERRQRNVDAIIEFMGILNPQLKSMEDYRQKLWDHIFLISDFKLDVESPYPIPTAETLRLKPTRLPYPKKYPKYTHLGVHLEKVVQKAMADENAEKRSGFAHTIAYYMKLAYNTWHRELVHDDAIRQELNAITGGTLEFSSTPYVKAYRERDDDQRFGKRGKQMGYQPRQGGKPLQQGPMGNKNRPQQKFQKKRYK